MQERGVELLVRAAEEAGVISGFGDSLRGRAERDNLEYRVLQDLQSFVLFYKKVVDTLCLAQQHSRSSACCEARTQAKSSVPLWTRLEQNEVKNPDKAP